MPWLKPYIRFNIDLIKDQTNEKALFKLMNNSVLGKRMENDKDCMETKLTTKEQMVVKYLSQNTFKGARYIDGLYMVEFYKERDPL